MRRWSRAPFVAASMLLLAAPGSSAVAQEGVDWGGLMAGIAHGTAMDEAAQESVATRRRGRARPVLAPTASLTYTRSPERSRANVARFLASARTRHKQGAAAFENQLVDPALFDRMEQALSAYGLRTDNVADAYTIYWLNAWLASRGRNDTPPRHQIAAVRAQAAEAMATLPEIARADNSAKQDMAESNLIQAALIGGFMDGAEGKPALVRQVAAAVRRSARQSGLDLDGMELTDAGFVPRSAAP